MIERRKTRAVQVGVLTVGGGAPVSIQSMTNTDTADVSATVQQIASLAAAGCDAVRVAVPNRDAARGLAKIKRDAPVPLIADIHYDLELALAALDAGFDKLRINPGTLGRRELFLKVTDRAARGGIPIRVGVNSGSIHKDYLSLDPINALVNSAMHYCQLLEDSGCHQLIVSLKSSSVQTTYAANLEFAAKTDYPLHLGVTEAGTLNASIIKSSMGIGSLLLMGIGDTIRVSVTGSPVDEIPVAMGILRAIRLRSGPELICCPTCGRCKFPLQLAADKVQQRLDALNLDLVVAVMGCSVNGPGEARHADLGIAFGPNNGVLFQAGVIVGTYPNEKLVEALLLRIDKTKQRNEVAKEGKK